MADNPMNIFRTVLTYAVFIILAPISTFFICKSVIFQGMFGIEGVAANVWSAVAAIIVLHVALGLYIIRAYSESGKAKPEKDDKVD